MEATFARLASNPIHHRGRGRRTHPFQASAPILAKAHRLLLLPHRHIGGICNLHAPPRQSLAIFQPAGNNSLCAVAGCHPLSLCRHCLRTVPLANDAPQQVLAVCDGYLPSSLSETHGTSLAVATLCALCSESPRHCLPPSPHSLRHHLPRPPCRSCRMACIGQPPIRLCPAPGKQSYLTAGGRPCEGLANRPCPKYYRICPPRVGTRNS